MSFLWYVSQPNISQQARCLWLQVLKKASSAKGVLVTAGELGCSFAFKKLEGDGVHSGYLPVLEVKVEDTTGAGDAFLSGFLFAMLQVVFISLLLKLQQQDFHAAALPSAMQCARRRVYIFTQLAGLKSAKSKMYRNIEDSFGPTQEV